MTNFLKATAALGLVLGLGVAAAPEASAKAHDQGSTGTPGMDVGRTTVGSDVGDAEDGDSSPGAQDLGSALGNGRDIDDTPAGEGPGASSNPGRSAAPGLQ